MGGDTTRAPTLGDALRSACQCIDRLDARLLLQHVSGCRHADLISRPETPLAPEQAAVFTALVERRAAGEPIAYLLGEADFRGLTLRVTPDVLVPRADTEVLVDTALAKLAEVPRAADEAPRLLDLGTGSGAVILGLGQSLPGARLTALDVSPAALAVAQSNAERHRIPVTFLRSDWWQALPAEARFHVIASNPPYIREDDPHLAGDGVRCEPMLALTDGVPAGDGLACIRILIAGAPVHLVAGGWLLFEHGYDQAPACRELLSAAGYEAVASWHDLAGIERVTGGRWPG